MLMKKTFRKTSGNAVFRMEEHMTKNKGPSITMEGYLKNFGSPIVAVSTYTHVLQKRSTEG